MERRGRVHSSSQVAARYSFVAGREFRRSGMLNAAIGEHSLTSIGMLNVTRRWNKEPVLFSHLHIAVRCVNWSGNEAFPSVLRGNAWDNVKGKETCRLCILIVSWRNFFCIECKRGKAERERERERESGYSFPILSFSLIFYSSNKPLLQIQSHVIIEVISNHSFIFHIVVL